MPYLLRLALGLSVLLVSEQTGEEIHLTRPSNLIGRSSDCDVVIKKSDVSKRHCRILIRSTEAEIEDLDSVNGTTINGEPVTRRELMNGDILAIADYSFRVELIPPQ